jgi:DNA polymerase III alpha subunit
MISTTKKKSQNKNGVKEIRSFLIANVDQMLESLNALKNQKKNDTHDIFSAFEEEPKQDIIFKKNYPIKDQLDILQEERNSLGVYMTSTPLNDYIDILNEARKLTGLNNKLHIAILEKSKKIFTKSQKMMFGLYLTLADTEIEGIIFPKSAALYSPILEEKKLYWIIGKIEDKSKEEIPKTDTESKIETNFNPTSESEIEDDPLSEEMIIEESAPKPVYVEKPKLLIEHIAEYDKDIAKFLSNSPTSLTIQKAIKKLDENQTKLQKNLPKEESIDIILSLELGELNLKIKQNLSSVPLPDFQLVSLYVLENGVQRKVKGIFYLKNEIINQINEIKR